MLPKRLARKTIYESNWINLHVDIVKMPSGAIIKKYHQLDYPYESIGVLLLNEKNEVCLIESLRFSTQSIEWEVPAGGISEDENILDAAGREVLEEIGFKAEGLRHTYSYNPSNGM